MAVASDSPYIVILRDSVKSYFGKNLEVHSDFESLADDIRLKTKSTVSTSTLERVWNYSTRGYRTISLFTLNLLSRYCGFDGWDDFCQDIKQKDLSESEMFDEMSITVKNLSVGDRLILSWPPDRQCIIRYSGDNRFIVEESENAKLLAGDTFTCHEFLLHKPLLAHDIHSVDNKFKALHYEAGTIHGLTSLRILTDPQKNF